MKNESELIELVVVDGMMEADIIKSKLESFEVPCMLKFEAVGRILGITTDGLGKVQVMVPPEYLQKAKDILDAKTDDELSQEDDK